MNTLDEAGQRRWLLETLSEVVLRLASPAAEQIAYLQRLGTGACADELALELDDVAEASLTREGLLTPEQRSSIRALQQHLEAMSGPEKAELWEDVALRSSQEWDEVRRRAKAALSKLMQPAGHRR